MLVTLRMGEKYTELFIFSAISLSPIGNFKITSSNNLQLHLKDSRHKPTAFFFSLHRMENKLNNSTVSGVSMSIISLLPSPVMQYFSSLLIGDEKSSKLWVQSEGELLFKPCNIHDMSCGMSLVELHNPWVVSAALKMLQHPRRLCCCCGSITCLDTRHDGMFQEWSIMTPIISFIPPPCDVLSV